MMKVLMQTRKTLFSVPGGDTVQILKTKEYLEKLGISVDISIELEPSLKDYDLVHIFNLMRPQEIYVQVLNARKQHKKVALSPIFGLYTEYERKARGGLIQNFSNKVSPYFLEYLKVLIRATKNKELHKGSINVLLKGFYKTMEEIVNIVDIFLPNSESEMKRIKNHFKLKKAVYKVVPNGVDANLFDYNNVQLKEAKKFDGCILCVSRIEGRKSQLNLVLAAESLPQKLVLIGSPAPNHIRYYKKVRKAAGINTIFIDHIPHQKLPQYYKAAKVHALISWMETPGLSSLEAGLMRCNLVITDRGDTREYFGNHAYYCEPDSIDSIRQAIIKACESPENPKLKEHILKNFTWEKTAEKTFEAYKGILS